MKKLEIKQLNEKEEEIVDALISLGMSRPIARVLHMSSFKTTIHPEIALY
jgi:predicted transcriptional regulator